MSLLPEFGAAFCSVLLESAPLVVLGFVIAGLLHEFVPLTLLKRGVGGRSLMPVLRAVGVGALLPICSCSTIPLGVGLTRSGASTGTALAFMTSSPALSPVSLFLGWTVLGPALVGWYATLAIGGALLIGALGNRWLADRESIEQETSSCGCGCHPPAHGGSRLLKAFRWSMSDLGVEVSQSLVLGLAVASFVIVAMPTGLVETWLSEPSWLALLAAVVIALPAYTCSVPSLVIAGSLISRGVDPGVAMVFLIAGPATNLGELNAIRAAMGARAALFYASMLITIALVAGAATSAVSLPVATSLGVHAGHAHTHALDTVILEPAESALAAQPLEEIALWRVPFATLIVLLALVSLFQGLSKRSAAANSVPHPEPASRLYTVGTR